MVKNTKKDSEGIFGSVKDKLIQYGVDYFKKNFEKTKKDFLKYIEREIERRIKREIRKYAFSLIAIVLFIVGMLFLLNGLIGGVVYLLGLPSFLTSVVFAILVLGTATFVYISR